VSHAVIWKNLQAEKWQVQRLCAQGFEEEQGDYHGWNLTREEETI
jgi:hypothetical protein